MRYSRPFLVICDCCCYLNFFFVFFCAVIRVGGGWRAGVGRVGVGRVGVKFVRTQNVTIVFHVFGTAGVYENICGFNSK